MGGNKKKMRNKKNSKNSVTYAMTFSHYTLSIPGKDTRHGAPGLRLPIWLGSLPAKYG